jgi:KDO2-lipid IV(A) lauroyltransferase
VRGERGGVRDTLDVARTFATYASCLAEVLSSGSKNARVPTATVRGIHNFDEALAPGRGIVFATAHTAGWEIVGPLLSRDRRVRVMMVMERERDAMARALQDEARRAQGLEVAHVGVDDPLASLPLLRHLRKGDVVALQIDRAPAHVRTRAVRLFDASGVVPEGPLRLAQLSGAPVLPVFCARVGYRSYTIVAYPPIFIDKRASAEALDAAAQRIADAMTDFVRAHPTHWFPFRQP